MTSHSSSTRLRVATAAAVVALGALACSSDKSTGPRDGSTLRFSQSDPASDTLDNTDNTLDRALDLRSTVVRTKGDSIFFVLKFSGPVRAATDNAANSVNGFIEIDQDNNSSTGDVTYTDDYGGTSGLGIEYRVDLFDAGGGSAPLQDGFLNAIDIVKANVAGDSVIVKLTRSQIGGDDGNFKFTVLIGTADRATDLAPNTGFYSVSATGTASVARPSASVAASGAVVGTRHAVTAWGARR
ncbi:MAG TPA: hypothetical protein VNS52_12180 [Gemmatimonadaceae bacterium]|nr:hypothetical protein [Gemmatimonadaceae bacterium]